MNDYWLKGYILDARPLSKRARRKPVGIAMILAGLLIAGVLTSLVPNTRQEWVLKDFKKVQGIYQGLYVQHGITYLCIMTPDGYSERIMVAKGVQFSRHIGVGYHVEVSYLNTDPTRPQLVQGTDIRAISGPDPENPGFATRYW